MSLETNCFRIDGLDELRPKYRQYRIAGLRHESSEYYGNLQELIRRLSFQMKAPVTTYDVEGETFLMIPSESGRPPNSVLLVRAVASLTDVENEIELDFGTTRLELDPVRLRFLQFVFQDPLWRDARLWQPGAGKPFFSKKPVEQFGRTDLYEGFAIRVGLHPEGGFGLIVDLRRKLVSRDPLPLCPTRERINAMKGRSCLYKMGLRWFEVTITGLADVKVGEPSIPLEGNAVSLIDYLQTRSPKPVPASIAHLSPEGATIYYRTNGPEQRSAPAALCHPVEDTQGQQGAKYHPRTVIAPDERYRKINRVRETFLKRIPVGPATLSVSDRAGLVKAGPFSLPSLRFGNNVTLPFVRNGSDTPDAIEEYGRSRLTLLRNDNAGFFEQSLLDRQYLVLPKSVQNSYGSQFLGDLKSQMKSLYPKGGDYDPEIVVYDDLTGRRDFACQARAIEKAVHAAYVKPGYALVMVHRYDRRPRSADQLAAWTVREFDRLFDIKAAVIHTEVSKKSYACRTRRGETSYVVKGTERKRLTGYLRNVALNKILLTNGKWPFVLDTALHADVVIGVDVKNNTAAFALIAGGGKIVRFATSPSRQKEQLLKAQVQKFIIALIRKEKPYFDRPPKRIVIHRDGRSWPAEIEGFERACETLTKDGSLAQDSSLTVIEISKSAPAPLRMFNVSPLGNGRGRSVQNPMVGHWAHTTPSDGYVCTTGRPFRIPGTANPLHIRRVAGDMSIQDCLSDVFSLSCLTWTRPEGAMRLPISITLCDRVLFDEAAEYDGDEVEFGNADNLQEDTHERLEPA